MNECRSDENAAQLDVQCCMQYGNASGCRGPSHNDNDNNNNDNSSNNDNNNNKNNNKIGLQLVMS